jgi:hypothetical protein
MARSGDGRNNKVGLGNGQALLLLSHQFVGHASSVTYFVVGPAWALARG